MLVKLATEEYVLDNFKYCKIEIYIPETHLSLLQHALQEVDAGISAAMTAVCLTARLQAAGVRLKGVARMMVK